MKFVIVLACLLAVAFASEDAKVLRNDAEVNVDNFKYALELDNTIKAVQEGVLKGDHNWVVSGEYEFVSPKGVHVKVTYVADEEGYHAKTSQ